MAEEKVGIFMFSSELNIENALISNYNVEVVEVLKRFMESDVETFPYLIAI
ncbi:hypothetical protein [Sutcliffiella halmapala]|uniref:hypothetical protein n=1 Tax=Sutcliffiella halmapala TaxID=79882 RepID=UPI00147411D7|nr:hypothetical protein [Sutcliffiella halmapala]